MKKFLSYLCFLLFTFSLSAQNTPEQVKAKIDNIIANKFFQKTSIAVDIYDLKDQKTIYQYHNKLLLNPASNMKVLTTSTALYFLGPDYEFETNFYYSGSITDSVLNGDLYVVGGCDPDFTSADLTDAVKKIKLLGINKISGNIYGDVSALDSWYWGEGWMWDDEPSTDFPYMSALNINSDAVTASITPKEDGTTIVNLIPQSSYFKLINNSRTETKENGHISVTRNWIDRTNDIIVSGSISSKSKTIQREVNVYQSHLYFLTLLKEELEKQNIGFNGNTLVKELADKTTLACSVKRKFGEVIVNLNKTSDNLSAEMTLRALALKCFGKPASAFNGLQMVDSLLTICGLDPQGYRLVDGSGISKYDLVSAEMLLTVLKYIYNNKPELYQILSNSFPIAGVDGSLHGRMKQTAAENNVHAKTGTLSGVSCLSGYVTTKGNHPVAFSILIQNYTGGKSNASRYEDEICRLLAEME